MKMKLRLKRVYDEPGAADGLRILVDRIWPRGLSKKKARVDHWAKDVAPSAELRQWFGHDQDKWQEFHCRYTAELSENEEAVDGLRRKIGKSTTSLVFAARDTEHNNAIVLRDFLVLGS